MRRRDELAWMRPADTSRLEPASSRRTLSLILLATRALISPILAGGRETA